MITKIRGFSLKQRDFASGQMISPDRSQWIKCDCCGKLIVQGAELSNGHKIGLDCEEVRSRICTAITCQQPLESVYRIFKPAQRVQDYIRSVILAA